RLDELTKRLVPLLEGPEAGVLAAKKLLTLASFEGLLAELPGDHRERLQEALGKNPTATSLVDVTAAELLQSYASSASEKKILAWARNPNQQHRVGLAVTAIRAYLEQQSGSAEAKRSNAIRTSLGHLLPQVHEKWAMPLVMTMKKLGITPIRPEH
ncbi:MAG: ATPase, partial [Polyangiaceae bacterium]